MTAPPSGGGATAKAAATTAGATVGAASGSATAAGAATGAAPSAAPSGSTEALLQIIASVLSLLGVAIAYLIYRRGVPMHARLAEPAGFRGLRRLLYSGLGFDWLYGWLFVKPFYAIARFLRRDFIDYLYMAIGAINTGFSRLFSAAQSGKVRWYLAGLAVGAIVAVGLVVWL